MKKNTDEKQNINSTATVKLLAGIRSGDVIECLIDFNRNYMTPEEIFANERLSQEQKDNEIQKLDFNSEFFADKSLRSAREEFERAYLKHQISKFGGNVSKTASYVGMERSALHRKMKLLNIESTLKEK